MATEGTKRHKGELCLALFFLWILCLLWLTVINLRKKTPSGDIQPNWGNVAPQLKKDVFLLTKSPIDSLFTSV